MYKGSLTSECRTVSALPTERHVDISLGSTIVRTCQKNGARRRNTAETLSATVRLLRSPQSHGN